MTECKGAYIPIPRDMLRIERETLPALYEDCRRPISQKLASLMESLLAKGRAQAFTSIGRLAYELAGRLDYEIATKWHAPGTTLECALAKEVQRTYDEAFALQAPADGSSSELLRRIEFIAMVKKLSGITPKKEHIGRVASTLKFCKLQEQEKRLYESCYRSLEDTTADIQKTVEAQK